MDQQVEGCPIKVMPSISLISSNTAESKGVFNISFSPALTSSEIYSVFKDTKIEVQTDVKSTIVEYTFKTSYIMAQLTNKHNSNFTISLNITDRDINGTVEGQTARRLEDSEKTASLYFEFEEISAVLFGGQIVENEAVSKSIKVVVGSTVAVSAATNF